jgi:hypothetical protein
METDPGEWELLLEEAEDQLFWDSDYESGDAFLDLPPDVGRAQLEGQGMTRTTSRPSRMIRMRRA